MSAAWFTSEFIEEQARLLEVARRVAPDVDPTLTVALWQAPKEER